MKKKEPSPNGCRNCCFSRKNDFESDGVSLPGFRCFKDNRTHSPDACCSHYRRRGRVTRKSNNP